MPKMPKRNRKKEAPPEEELSEYEKIRLRNIREKDKWLEAILNGTPWTKPKPPGKALRKQLHPKKFVRTEPKKETVQEKDNEKKDEGCRSDRDENNNEPEKPNEITEPRKKVQEEEGGGKKRSRSPMRGEPSKHSRSLRERRQVNYTEEEIPNADEFIFCDICEQDYLNGCPDHLIPRSDSEFAYVCKSRLKKAGRGVVNTSQEVIPAGTLFGPYKGKIVLAKDYDRARESGYAWEVRDSSEKRTVTAYVDPGSDPDPSVNWLCMVNAANYRRNQNITATQYRKEIYYRVSKPIYPGTELLTSYGDDYAKELGIDLKKFRFGVDFQEYHDEDIIDCPHCGQHFGKEDDLNTHRCEAKRTKNAKVYCDTCKKGFCDAHYLKLHVETVHLGVKKYKCEICEKAFGHESVMKSHVRSVHGDERHPCSQCDRDFSTAINLRRHILSAHQGKTFKCGTCGRAFTRADHLKTHISAVHQKQRLFDCTHCSKRFPQKGHLIRHVKTVHEQIKEYKCPECGRLFGHKLDLKRHLASIHTKNFPYECYFCTKGFLKPGDKRQHIAKKHPAEYAEIVRAEEAATPWVCELCSNRFKTKEGLNRHTNVNH